MNETLAQILNELLSLRDGVSRVESKLDEFRRDQDVTNKLLAGDTAGIKNYMKDLSKDSREFRREVREWQLTTNRRIDTLEEKLYDVKEALG